MIRKLWNWHVEKIQESIAYWLISAFILAGAAVAIVLWIIL
jgi:hypothetical protein